MILCSSGVFFNRGDDGRLFVPGGSDVEAVSMWAPRLGVDGIEVLVTHRMVGTMRSAADQLTATGLRFPVIHGPKRLGAALPGDEAVSQLEESASFAAGIGASVLVLHLWDLPESDRRFEERLDALVVAADVLDRYGVTLAVETIPCHLGTPLRNVERVLERDPRVSVALDTEFLALHGELEEALAADWLWDEGRVKHVHIKDFSDGLVDPVGSRRYLLPGAGSIDFVGFFGALEGRGFRGTVSLEAPAWRPDGSPDTDALARVIARMSHSPWRYSAATV